ncbi:MAG: TetR family transcriptional regulator [Clostridia bacterium]|nr:TetR family transcriptional regulator [Clostridia bacterium]
MSSFTRQAIMDSFLRLLERKPFPKITVRDIVEECGVNRTTFYYYYQDIYAIVEDLFSSALLPYADMLRGNTRPSDLRDARDFATMHRRALLGLYTSLGHEAVRKYLFAVLDEPLTVFLTRCGEGLELTESARRTVFLLLRETLLGVLCLFLRGELPEDGGFPLTVTGGTVRRFLERLSQRGEADRRE